MPKVPPSQLHLLQTLSGCVALVLRERREEADLTVLQTIQRLGGSSPESLVRRMEQGTSAITIDYLAAACRALDLDPVEVIKDATAKFRASGADVLWPG